jgi:hypothetical protein
MVTASKKTMLLIVVSVLIACLLGCSSGHKALLWETDNERGMFYTYDLERAQEELPFTIILPTYLPDNMREYPYLEGTLRHGVKADKPEVRVIFQEVEAWKGGGIEIYERNYTMLPPSTEDNPELFYIDIEGVQVLVDKLGLSQGSPENTNATQGWEFWWDRQNIYFDVSIYQYDWDTATKMIESMIQQKQ